MPDDRHRLRPRPATAFPAVVRAAGRRQPGFPAGRRAIEQRLSRRRLLDRAGVYRLAGRHHRHRRDPQPDRLDSRAVPVGVLPDLRLLHPLCRRDDPEPPSGILIGGSAGTTRRNRKRLRRTGAKRGHERLHTKGRCAARRWQ